MTRLLTDGAELGNLNNLSNTIGGLGGARIENVSSVYRSGIYSYKAWSGSVTSGITYAYYTIPQLNELYFRIGVNTTNANKTVPEIPFIQISNNSITPLIAIKIVSGFANVYINDALVSQGSISILSNTWILIECHIKIGNSGIVETRINGEPDINYYGNTIVSGITTTDRFCFGARYCSTYYDDIAINDINGDTDNSWCDDGHIIAIFPNANGDSSQFVGNDLNSVDNYLLINEALTDGDTTFVESDIPGNKDLYNLAPSGLVDSKILRMWTEVAARDTTTGNGLIKLLTKINSVEYESESIPLFMVYQTKKGPEYLLNPNTGLPWTLAQLEDLQIGVKVVN